MSARVHPQASGRALAASAAGAKSGRNLFKRQLTQREFELEQEHRRLDLFEYLVSFNAEQAAKRDDGDVAPSRIEESLQKAAESCPMASAIRRARRTSIALGRSTTGLLFGKETLDANRRAAIAGVFVRHAMRRTEIGELDWEKPHARQLYMLSHHVAYRTAKLATVLALCALVPAREADALTQLVVLDQQVPRARAVLRMLVCADRARHEFVRPHGARSTVTVRARVRKRVCLVARPRRKAGRGMRCVRGDVLRRHRERARRHDGEFSQRACAICSTVVAGEERGGVNVKS